MIWTTNKPTIPGVYFYRERAGAEQKDTLRLTYDQVTGNLMVRNSLGNYPRTSDCVKDLDGEWFGPIEPPQS